MMQCLRPLKGCQIRASDNHHTLRKMDYVGEVIAVDGDIVTFRDRAGETDRIIWRFKDGLNSTIIFGA